jgi:hypothetical protein
VLRRSPEESLMEHKYVFTRVLKPIFWTGVVVLVFAIPEFLFVAVWLWVRQGTVNTGVWTSLLGLGMCLSTLRLVVIGKPTASKRRLSDLTSPLIKSLRQTIKRLRRFLNRSGQREIFPRL